MIALLEARRAGLFGREHLWNNVLSGLIVGIVALPLAMAFAIASGAKPEQGLYTSIVAGLLVAVLGGSRVQITGPTGAFIVILAGVTAKYGISGLQLATIMAGCMLLALGAARLGAVIKFIPAPVVVGFTAGIGVIIWVGQWKDFFGLHPAPGGHFHEQLWHLLQALPHLHPATTALAALSLALVIFGPRIPGLTRVPGPMFALVVATVLQSLFQFDGVATIKTAFGGIPLGLPHWQLPDFSVSHVIELIGPAFAIALLGAIESLLTAVVADGMAGTRHDPNQELMGQGIANIVTPFFGGFAATGAIARTATNIRNGGTSPLAGIVHSLLLLLLVMFLAPLANNIPLASLSAVLFVVAWNMSGVPHFWHMARRAPRADVLILLVSFVLTVFTDLVVAVNIGVIIAILQFLRRMASSVDVSPQGVPDLGHELAQLGLTELPRGVMVYAVQGPLFFGATDSFERALAATRTDPDVLIIRLRWVPFIDISGVETLEEIVRDFKKRGVRIMLTGANERVRGKLEKAGIISLVGEENVFETFPAALATVATGVLG